jgi:hypothetical protein
MKSAFRIDDEERQAIVEIDELNITTFAHAGKMATI